MIDGCIGAAQAGQNINVLAALGHGSIRKASGPPPVGVGGAHHPIGLQQYKQENGRRKNAICPSLCDESAIIMELTSIKRQRVIGVARNNEAGRPEGYVYISTMPVSIFSTKACTIAKQGHPRQKLKQTREETLLTCPSLMGRPQHCTNRPHVYSIHTRPTAKDVSPSVSGIYPI